MGLMMGFLGGVGKGVADVSKIYLDKEAEVDKAERIAEATSRLRLGEEQTIRDRNKADAVTERARIETDARGFAEKRGGMMAANAGLDDVNYRGDEGVGINVQKGQSEPTVRDRLMASGKYEAVAADERADKTATQHVKERAEDVRFKEAELKLRQASEGRLAKSADLDTALKQIALDNTKRVQVLREEFAAAAPERRAKINEEIQLITGKDNDKFMPVPIKDDMDNVSGYKIFDTKAGRFVEQNAGAGGGSKYNDATGEVTVDGKVTATIAKGLKSREEVQAALAKSKPAGKDTGGAGGEPVSMTGVPTPIEDVPALKRSRYRDLKGYIDSGQATLAHIKEFNAMSDKYFTPD